RTAAAPESHHRAQPLGEAGLPAVLEPAHRGPKRPGVRTSRSQSEPAVVRHGLALVTASEAKPAAGLAAPRAARYEQDVADREGEAHHLVVELDEMSSSPACVPVVVA